MPHFLWITLTLSRTMTGRDKMVINMKELKEKTINSNIIKDQHNKYRSFRGSFKIRVDLLTLFDFHRQCNVNNQINDTICKVDIEQF